MLYKRDLKRAYRQIPIDPGDINLLGVSWRNCVFIDRVAPFGLRSAAMMCQRTTSAVKYIFKEWGFEIVNYLDDFAGAETVAQANIAFLTLASLFKYLGLEESQEKACTPCTSMIFIGILFDTTSMTLQVTKERLIEMMNLLPQWLDKRKVKCKDLQSLIGKLQFVSKCVRSSRIFISRMLVLLRGVTNNNSIVYLNDEFRKDIRWWIEFLPLYNGVSLIPETNWSTPDEIFSSDASLVGCGGFFMGNYYHSKFPKIVKDLSLHINALEMLSIVVAFKVWGHLLTKKNITVFCDNLSCVMVINSGRTRDPFLLKCLRELCFISSIHEFTIRARHLTSNENRIADILSRWDILNNPKNLFEQATKDLHFQLKEYVITDELFKLSCKW